MPSPVPALVSKRRGWPAFPAASGRATGTFVSTAPVLAGKTPAFVRVRKRLRPCRTWVHASLHPALYVLASASAWHMALLFRRNK